MSICGSYVQTIVLRHDAGMFTVKGINRLKILQDAIDRNGNYPTPHDKSRNLDPSQITRAENSSASLQAALYWRADTN